MNLNVFRLNPVKDGQSHEDLRMVCHAPSADPTGLFNGLKRWPAGTVRTHCRTVLCADETLATDPAFAGDVMEDT